LAGIQFAPNPINSGLSKQLQCAVRQKLIKNKAFLIFPLPQASTKWPIFQKMVEAQLSGTVSIEKIKFEMQIN